MKFIEKNLLGNFGYRSHLIALLTTIFALFYHTGFLITFYFLNVKEMFVFNIFSVTLFLVILLVRFSMRNLLISYSISYIEVVLHQILAIYYVGFSSSFQYLILIIGFLPFLIFNVKFYRSVIFSLSSITIFILTYAFDSRFYGIYNIDPSVLAVIKITNVSLSLLLIIIVIMIFTQIILNNEKILTNEIKKTKDELTFQSELIIALQNNMIIRLANLVENRDSDTGLHVKRTSIYAKLIAQRAMEKGLYTDIINESYVNLIFKAAPLHDIGKIVVSDVILKKPGKLTAEEFTEMQKHTTEGKRIIGEILFDQDDKEYIRVASEIAGCHHEKWNGTGYPNKLQGNEIPLSARIMALADVYDALVSPRCYKDPIPPEHAFEIIKKDIGTHFDPLLGQLFIDIKDEVVSLEF